MHIAIDPGAAAVLDALHRAGHRAYLVGGCVRDSLAGRAPQDWDICTSARPDQTLALFGETQCIPTGLQHGTVTVRQGGGLYEVTTFRVEEGYTDGRHPDHVAFVADVKADLARRDFTINAMAYDPAEGLIDPFGGRADQQVLPAAEGVHQTLFFIIGHGVDGEIPPGQILGHIGHKIHLVRVAAVGVGSLHPEGGDLVKTLPLPDGDRPVFQPGGDALLLSEQEEHLFRPGAGTEVPVSGGFAEKAVPHAAPHSIGFVPGGVELSQQGRRPGVEGDVWGHGSSSKRRVICLPSAPHSAAGKAARASPR